MLNVLRHSFFILEDLKISSVGKFEGGGIMIPLPSIPYPQLRHRVVVE